MTLDGHLDPNYLKGPLGDRINPILTTVGYNFCLILKKPVTPLSCIAHIGWV